MTLQEIADTLDFDEPTNLVKFSKKYENTTPEGIKERLNNLNYFLRINQRIFI